MTTTQVMVTKYIACDNQEFITRSTGDTLDLDDAQREMYLELLGEDVS